MGNVGGSVTGIVRARSQKVGCVPKKIYECVNYRKYGKSRCVCHNIREDRLVANFKQFLILVKENYEQEINHLKLEEYQSSKGKSLKGLKIDLENLKTEYKIIIAEKIKELSSCQLEKRRLLENTYAMLEDEKYKEIVHVKRQIKELEKEDLKIKKEKLKKAIDYFDEIVEQEELDKTILNRLLDKIYIYHDKSVQFELKVGIEKLLE